jgi:hypothetical protein
MTPMRATSPLEPWMFLISVLFVLAAAAVPLALSLFGLKRR